MTEKYDEYEPIVKLGPGGEYTRDMDGKEINGVFEACVFILAIGIALAVVFVIWGVMS